MLNLQWSAVKRFHDVAWKHVEAADYLLFGCSAGSASTRAAEAIYLGGYGAECILKAVLLSSVREKRHPATLALFKEKIRHDIEALKAALERLRKPVVLPERQARAFRHVRRAWSSALRYEPGMRKTEDAALLLIAVKELVQWACGRKNNATADGQETG